jgi:hypothetical protein
MMTPMQRQRLTDLMNSIDYQRRQAKRILIALCLLGIIALMMAAVTSCSSPPLESRAATINLTESDLRDARGRFVVPTHRVTHEPAATQQTIYRTATAAEMHGPVYRLKPASTAVDHAQPTEIPRLTD